MPVQLRERRLGVRFGKISHETEPSGPSSLPVRDDSDIGNITVSSESVSQAVLVGSEGEASDKELRISEISGYDIREGGRRLSVEKL